MHKQLILRCEDSLEGIYTAIYDAFVYKNRMDQPYEDTISIVIGAGESYTLFADEIVVGTSRSKAEKTVHAIRSRLGNGVSQTLLQALCHFDGERATVVLGYLVRGFHSGSRIAEQLADPYVMRVMELSRKCGRECEKLYGFLRFQDTGHFLLARIEPKCNAIPLLEGHFADRYPNENFIIYDAGRRYALVHPAYRRCYYVRAEEFEFVSKQEEDIYETLWKQYFQTMGIRERKNERCQNNMLPKWYRKDMTEFD